MEIERKYLFDALPGPEAGYVHLCLTQAYISRSPVIRIRQTRRVENGVEVSCSYRLTVKGGGLSMREEFELPLTEDQFASLKRKAEGNPIEKTRYLIPLEKGLTAEADVFHGAMEGLRMVEVEFPDEAAMNAFEKPDWFGVDVTEDRRYHNSNMTGGVPERS